MSPESILFRDRFIENYSKKDMMVKQDCKVCKSKELNIFSEIDKFGFYYPSSICSSCGNVQQKYYYDESTLVDFYSNYYRKIYGAPNPLNHFKAQRKLRGLNILNFIKQHTTVPKKVLEVGCGSGGILSRFIDEGCTVLGLDFDDDYLEAARNYKIPVIKGSIEVLDKEDKFDLIILSHVLEHLVKPSEFLNDLSKHLSRDGIIYIEVPSLDSISEGSHNYDLLHYWEVAHLSHFTVETLSLICKTAGLQPIIITNKINSIYKISSSDRELNEKEKKNSLDHSRKLLFKIEKNRKSLKARIIIFKTFISKIIKKFISILGIKSFIKSVYF